MKFNKWTLGLAAVGAVSMASAVRADEAKMSMVNTALSSTTLSGYVDVAAQYNLGDVSQRSTQNPVAYTGGNGVVDGFSLNVVDIALDKPLDDSPWASGYHVELNAGQNALNASFGNGSTFNPTTPGTVAGGSAAGIRQAYVTLRTPVGNGIDWKFGAFDGVTGYEANTGYLNPNYTRSYGWAVNPASQVGLLGTYKVCSEITVTAGLVNRDIPSASAAGAPVSSKSYVGLVSFTAPDSWGWIKGSALNVGTVQTFDAFGQNNYSVSLTMNTPVTGLKGGLAFDDVQQLSNAPGGNHNDGQIYGLYATYQQSDKLSYNFRGEWLDFPTGSTFAAFSKSGLEATFDVEYDIWANVTSRVEARWDHSDHNDGAYGAGTHGAQDAFVLALNLVYKF